MVHNIIQYLQHTENYHTSTVSTELDCCSSSASIGLEGMCTSYYCYSRTKYLNSLSCPVPPSNAKWRVKTFPIVITRLKRHWNMQQSQWLIIVITLVKRLNEGWKKFGLDIREEFLRVRLAVPNPSIPEGRTGTSPGAELHLRINLQQAFIRDKCARLYLFIYAAKRTQCSSKIHRQTK